MIVNIGTDASMIAGGDARSLWLAVSAPAGTLLRLNIFIRSRILCVKALNKHTNHPALFHVH